MPLLCPYPGSEECQERNGNGENVLITTTCCSNGSPANFYKDIGRVSAQAFAIQLKKMHCGDIWISVLDSETQVIIEPMTNNAAEMSKLLGIR